MCFQLCHVTDGSTFWFNIAKRKGFYESRKHEHHIQTAIKNAKTLLLRLEAHFGAIKFSCAPIGVRKYGVRFKTIIVIKTRRIHCKIHEAQKKGNLCTIEGGNFIESTWRIQRVLQYLWWTKRMTAWKRMMSYSLNYVLMYGVIGYVVTILSWSIGA